MQFKTVKVWEDREDVTLTVYALDNCFDVDPERKWPAFPPAPDQKGSGGSAHA